MAVERLTPESVEVDFDSTISQADNCLCSACHDHGYVIKVKLPKTVYASARKLRTSYEQYWLCRKCRDKLEKAIEWPKED